MWDRRKTLPKKALTHPTAPAAMAHSQRISSMDQPFTTGNRLKYSHQNTIQTLLLRSIAPAWARKLARNSIAPCPFARQYAHTNRRITHPFLAAVEIKVPHPPSVDGPHQREGKERPSDLLQPQAP